MDDDFSAPAYQMHKHSLLLNGHQTSVSLEDAFWDELMTIAKSRNQSINKLVTEIDHLRTTNLSSALRVFVLSHLKSEERA